MTPLLDIQGLRASFFTRRGEVRVLDGVSLTIQRGEVVGLVGESGSGKSVTATSILRLLRHPGRIVGGRILLDGVDLGTLDEPAMQEVRGRKVAMIFQSPRACLDPVIRVGRQLLTVLRERRGVVGAEGLQAARELLGQVRLPEPDRVMAAYPHELSGGMCQRVMIAAALACRPQLLLADEPTTGLDVTIQHEIIALLHDLTATTGMAQLLISHDMGVVGEACDAVAVMYAGQVVEVARKSALFEAPQHPYTIGLLTCRTRLDADGPLSAIPGTIPDLVERPSGCPFAPRCDRARDLCQEVRPPLSPAGGGAHRSLPLPRTVLIVSTPPVLEVRDLVMRYPIRTGWFRRTWLSAVDGVSLTVRAGETVALVGESGSGKSTLARCVLRLDRPSEGRILVNGRDITELGYAALRPLRRDMQMVFQDPGGSLNPRLRVATMVAEPLWLFGLEPVSRARTRAVELLGRVGLDPEQAGRYPTQLSGGQQQRASVARAIVAGPRLVVLDEPTSALDVSVQANLINLLRELQATLGLAYLFISHDLTVVSALATRVAVMYRGRIVETGPTREVFRAPRHPYTQALIAAVPADRPDAPRPHVVLRGEIPSRTERIEGCRLVGRCPFEMPVCRAREPVLDEVAPGHLAACYLYSLSSVPNGGAL